MIKQFFYLFCVLVAWVFLASVYGCAPKPLIKMNDTTINEEVQKTVVCRDTKTGRYVKCPSK